MKRWEINELKRLTGLFIDDCIKYSDGVYMGEDMHIVVYDNKGIASIGLLKFGKVFWNEQVGVEELNRGIERWKSLINLIKMLNDYRYYPDMITIDCPFGKLDKLTVLRYDKKLGKQVENVLIESYKINW